MITADVTLHLDTAPSDAVRADIHGRLESLDGVIEIVQTAKQQHLLVVRFDSHKLHTDDILEAVRRTGVHAELLGL